MYIKRCGDIDILHPSIRMGGGRGGKKVAPVKKGRSVRPAESSPTTSPITITTKEAPFPVPAVGLKSLIELSSTTTHVEMGPQRRFFYGGQDIRAILATAVLPPNTAV
jgi:hypothetical protein